MYRIAHIQVGHPRHTRKDQLDEEHVFYNNEQKAVEIFTGPKAKIEARNYIQGKSWLVKQNDHGLGDILIAA